MVGQRNTLLKLATMKFGDVPAAARQCIESGAMEDVERWLERILTVRSIDEVLSD